MKTLFYEKHLFIEWTYSQYKNKRKLLNEFLGGEKIIDFQNDSISVALPFKKDLYNRVSAKI